MRGETERNNGKRHPLVYDASISTGQDVSWDQARPGQAKTCRHWMDAGTAWESRLHGNCLVHARKLYVRIRIHRGYCLASKTERTSSSSSYHHHIHGLGCGTQGVGIGETTSKRGFSRLPRRSHVSVFVFSFLFFFLRGGYIFFRFSPTHLFLLALSLPIFILAVVPPPPPSMPVSCVFVFTF
ncbi:hypothetical protein LZ31DRAFT_33373 [Colletotrichum somersetense]|nr:hypothetical protein LZ31DRAFT_33373 [Colletotrichum somersetense]